MGGETWAFPASRSSVAVFVRPRSGQQDGADHVAAAHRAERVVPVLERSRPGDHRSEVELPVERPLREPREVLLRQVVASVRDEDARAAPEEGGQVEGRRLARRGKPDQNDGPARRDQAERLLEGGRHSDHVEREVDRAGLGVGRAELHRLLELAFVEVERADLRCPGDARPLDHGQTDCTAADHGDPRALPHPGRLEDGHHTGRNGAAEQTCLLDGQLQRDPHGGRGRHDRVRRERPRAQHRGELGAVVTVQPPRRGRRFLALPRLAAEAHGAAAAGGLPSEHDPVALPKPAGALLVPDGHDRPRAFVPEQDRQRVMPPVLLDHVQVAVADAARLDPDEHNTRAGGLDAALLEGDGAGLAEDYAAVSHERSRSRIECAPASARPRSISAIRFWINSSTPRCPPTARAYAYGRPMRTASAPRATAFSTSAAQRMPPSINTTASGSASRTSTSASSAATAPSTWRPPWFDTTTPSMPWSSASCASSAVSTPLTSSGSDVCPRSQSRSSQVSPRFGNVASIIAAAVSRSSSGGLSSRAVKTGSVKYCPQPSPRMNGRDACRRSRGRQPSVRVSSVTTIAP